jgi:predicted dehydrogenase
VRSGEIGELRSIVTSFSYFNRDPANVRNKPEWGGGALLDIGCYAIQISRYLYGAEPERVSAVVERDPEMGIDRLTSGLLDFGAGQSAFTVGMQMAPWQRVTILGTDGRIDIEIPFNAPPDRPTRIFVEPGNKAFRVALRTEEFPVCDQYTIQGDLFSRAIREGGEVPTPLEDAAANMAVIEAVFRAAESGRWESPEHI